MERKNRIEALKKLVFIFVDTVETFGIFAKSKEKSSPRTASQALFFLIFFFLLQPDGMCLS